MESWLIRYMHALCYRHYQYWYLPSNHLRIWWKMATNLRLITEANLCRMYYWFVCTLNRYLIFLCGENYSKFYQKKLDEFNLHKEMRLIDSPEQMSHLLEGNPVATVAYFDAFYNEAVFQNYSTEYICRTIERIMISPNSKPFPSSFIAKKSSELTQYFNYGWV